ncbi:MAG: hypothetical protein ACRDTG_23220 [Pseudonocardiaceae bacterium]
MDHQTVHLLAEHDRRAKRLPGRLRPLGTHHSLIHPQRRGKGRERNQMTSGTGLCNHPESIVGATTVESSWLMAHGYLWEMCGE